MAALLPLNVLRVLAYRTLGYRIQGSRIGWGTVIAVAQANLDHCHIGRGNRFLGPMQITIDRGAWIGNDNSFLCGAWSTSERFNAAGYERRLRIGEGAIINGEHYFDVVGSFSLGSESWIGGVRSQFWTHGPGASERNITIGNRCYVGSGVMFAPGSAIGDNCIVAIGSVVTKSFTDQNALIAGQPARVVRTDYDWKAKKQAFSRL